MFTQRNTTPDTTPTAATTTPTSTKKSGFFHRLGMVCSLVGALLGADTLFFSFSYTNTATNYVVLVSEVVSEVAARHSDDEASAHSSHPSSLLCEEDEDLCFSEAEVEAAADEGAEKVVTTPRPHTPRPHTPRPHTPRPHTPRPRRSAKSAEEEMCQRLRLVSRMVRKVAGDHRSRREAARLHVDNLVDHANGRPSRVEAICGI
ncbi:MAG: hypothetical protein HOL80_01835 [Candidatus Magasanikbacteria bacterium]|nr:hypothetical protein [Candidatus Magasanikbacteria bacterium]